MMRNGFFCAIIAIFFFSLKVSAITYYSRATGNWGSTSTWSTVGCGGVAATAIPGSGDDVIICAGHTVTMSGNPGNCLSLTINGVANWSSFRTTNVGAGGLTMTPGSSITGSKTGNLNVSGGFTTTAGASAINIGRVDLTITGTSTVVNGSTLQLNDVNGTKTFGSITVSGVFSNAVNIPITINGDLQNNGTYNVGTGQVTFGGSSSNTITGTSTTNFTSLLINKGTSSASVLDVQSIITLSNGGLTLSNGTFKLSNSSISIIPFPADIETAPYLIPSTAGLWCNGATVNSDPALTSSVVNDALCGNWTVAGLLRISAGTLNLGTVADQCLRADNSGTTQIIMEGGSFNIAGRLTRQLASDVISFTMSGGTVVVPSVGSTDATNAPIHLNQAGDNFSMSGGTIVIRQAGGANLGFLATAGTVAFSGGTIQFGDASTPAGQTMQMNCSFNIANLMVYGTNSPTCQLATNLTVLQSIDINSGATLDANNLNIILGNSWTSSGTFIPGSGTVICDGTGTQTFSRSGGETFNNFTIDKISGTVLLSNNIQVNSTLTMTQGNIDCGANTLTLGVSTASTGTLTYTSGTIIGSFQRWINSTGTGILFPIGTSSYYRSALITFTNITGGTLSANFVSSDPGNSGLPLSESGRTISNQYTEGYWVMTAANGLSSTNYDIELTGNGFTSYAISSSTRVLYRTSGSWSLNGTHVDASGSTVKRSGINGLSAQFGFGKPSCSPYVATTVNGSSSVCTNAVETYSVNANDAANTYTWSLPLGGGAITGGQGTPTVTVTWGATGQQASVQVVEQNDCGDNNTAVTTTVTVNPIATSTISGAVTVAANENGVAYSVENIPGYSYAWSFPVGGGTQASGGTTNSITVNWGAAPGTYTLRADVTRLCGAPDFQELSVIVRGPIKSTGSASWANAGTWDCGCIPTASDYVEIQAGHTVLMNDNPGACYKLTINGTANWTQARTTNVGAGGIVINSTGDISGTGAGILTTTGGITGNLNAGITSSSVDIRVQTTTGQSITSDGYFRKLTINADAVNAGTIIIENGGTLAGSAKLTQSASSTLTMRGSTFSLTTLDASAAGNTVIYGANADQTIRAATYDNLTFSTTGTTNTKTLDGAIVVNGDLNITGITLDVSSTNYAISVAGDWTNTGTFNPRYGTVTFNGGSAQIISASGGETFNNLNMTGTGTKTIANDITINFDFTNSSTVSSGVNDINIKGNWDNSGTINLNNDVTFSNNSTIIGSNTDFNNIIITGTLGGHATNMNVSGTWTNNGTFNHNNGTVTLNGATQTIAGTSANTFNDLVIAGTGTKTLGAAITTDGDLTISSTLDVSATNYGVNVNGDLINNGVFTTQAGTVTLGGTGAQSISGSTVTNFHNITITNASASGVSLGSAQNLKNTLILGANAKFTTTGQIFTLVSDASATARIAAVPATASIVGNITQQRYVTGNTGWKNLGSAVSGITLDEWNDDLNTTGIPGSDSPGHSFVSIYTYDETATGSYTNGYTAPLGMSDAIVQGKGYFVYGGPFPVTLDVAGTPTIGNVTLPVTYTSSGGAAHDGWNIVANPYPSSIDWDAAGWTKTNVNNAIYVWNPALEQYASYVGGIGNNGGTNIIPSSQAFWVQTNAASPSLSVTENVKSATDQTFLKRSANSLLSSVSLMKLKITGNNFSDETSIRFDSDATVNFDESLDAAKLFSTNVNVPGLSSVMNSVNLSINSLPELTSTYSIPIRVRVGVSGTYSISLANDYFNIPSSSCLFLEDLKTGAITNLRTTSSYSFYIIDTTASPRFLLKIGAPVEKSSSSASCNGSSDGMAIAKGIGTGPWTYVWKNPQGSNVKTSPNLNTPDTLFNLSAGVYTIEVTGGSFCGNVMDTIIISQPQAIFPLVSKTDASCNGESDGFITVPAVEGGAGNYSYTWSNGETVQNIYDLYAGNYTLLITDGQGCSSSTNVTITEPPVLKAAFILNADTVYLSNGGVIMLNNTSTGASTYSWDFGDGGTQMVIASSYQYNVEGDYTISLIATNGSCYDTTNKQVTVLGNILGINDQPISSDNIGIINNSTGASLKFNYSEYTSVTISVLNSLGQKVTEDKNISVSKEIIELNFNDFSQHIYFIRVVTENSSWVKKIAR